MTASDVLYTLAADRAEARRIWLAGNIGDCACARPALRTDAHATGDGGFHHLDCGSATTESPS